jgi:tRNA threonylcarbamoyladenosine biosynthesis protein TsaE
MSSSEEETRTFGKRLASLLKKGSVVALKGSLGSGKTTLVKGIARGLGIDEEITSPSYTIISEYETIHKLERIPLYHIDAYRLSGNEDFLNMGGEDIVFGGGISLIEWGERIPDFIPSDAIMINIEIIAENDRQITVRENCS